MTEMKQATRKTPAGGRDTTTTFSTRLSSEEKELIERAAEIREWTPSKLMRLASVERAANIVNLHESRLRNTLQRLADDVATQLWEPHLVGEGGGMYELLYVVTDAVEDSHGNPVSPSAMNGAS